MIEKLYWEKYRPKTLEDIILLPRIRKQVENGIVTNLIFYGHYGMGKTALSRILSKRNPNLELNSSLDTSIDVLRKDISDFCSKMSMFDGEDDVKIVFLDEVDRVSAQYQDALKGFIESNSRNTRFIFTTNHIEKITPGNLSRFTKVNFDPQTPEEVKWLKNEYAKRLIEISEKEEVDVDKKDVVNIVNKHFPDLRQMTTSLQEVKLSGIKVNAINNSKRVELFDKIITLRDTTDMYNYIMIEYGDDGISEIMNSLGRPFIEWVGKSKSEYLPKLVDILEIVTRYTDMLDNRNQDPIIVGLTAITQIQKVLN